MGKSAVPSIGETAAGSQPGCSLASFQMPSMAFQTDDAPVIGSLTMWTWRRSGQTTAPTLALIHAALGGSWNSRCGQRQVGRPVAILSEASSASIACGCIGPMITAVIWLRSMSATGISAFSGPGARTSAWKMRSVSSWRRTRVVRSIIARVRRVVCSRRWRRSIGRPPASESAFTTEDAHTPTGSSRVIIDVAVSRSARVEAKCSRIACAGEPVTTRSLVWRSMIWPRSLTSVAMLSMIAVAANPCEPPTCVSSKSACFVLSSRADRRSPKSDVSMKTPGSGSRGEGRGDPMAESRRHAWYTFGYIDVRQGVADGRWRR